MVAVSTNFADLLDPRFERIFNETTDRAQVKDMISTFYGSPPDNGRADMRFSSSGAFQDFTAFSGTVEYDDVYQGYDVTQTHVEFASGFQVERKLFDDDQYNIMDKRPAGLAQAATRTRQKHAARLFNNAFSVDSFFYNHSEGVALCSNSHTTNSPASTANGFDNLLTSALTATALATARIQFVNFRDDRGNYYNSVPDCILIPPDLYMEAHEIIQSTGKPDTGENNSNVHKGAYDVIEWIYLTDTNNWFLCDKDMMKQSAHWVDRIPLEFAMAEDIDTIIAKWRAYMRYSASYDDWRFILGNQVS